MFAEFDNQIANWLDAVGSATQEAAAGIAEVALQEILEESPQWSGDFVSSWDVSIDTPSRLFRPRPSLQYRRYSPEMGDPFEKGDPIAIEYAMSKARGRLKTARSRKLGTSVYLSNNAYHDEPYAWDIEDGNIKFRPENPNASHVVERAARKTAAEFATITKSKLALLRGIGA